MRISLALLTVILAPLAHGQRFQQSPAPRLFPVWTNDGGDKVIQTDLRASLDASSVLNSTWDGNRIRLFGARNEVVGFNLVIEAPRVTLENASVDFKRLDSGLGHVIQSHPAPGQDLFDWTSRPIELFFVRYLTIEGLSKLSYETYDERHIPERMRRPWTGLGSGSGTWWDRPDHDQAYPEIAVPIELVPHFDVAQGTNQSVWIDVYIPKDALPATYTGTVLIRAGGVVLHSIPVELNVRDFELADDPSCETMAVLGYPDINLRYTGLSWPNCGTPQDITSKLVRDRHFMMAHRHRISLIDSETSGCSVWKNDAPRPEWLPRLDGSLFTAATGYEGPGEGIGNGVYSIGNYGSWWWKGQGQAAMWARTDGWVNWFEANSPTTERFLYLIDESTNYAQTEQWAGWIESNPGPGNRLMSLATQDLPATLSSSPSLDVTASWMRVGITSVWDNAAATIAADPTKRFDLYNGHRPAGGSFATEDDGVALRVLAWAQFKKEIDRWFYWETTYYNNYQAGMGQTNVFESAHTFGSHSTFDNIIGETGWNYSNGDGVLFYPGTDSVYPSSSYGILGPIASLRLKHWRRGIQDYEYLKMAQAKNPAAVASLVDSMIPKVLWEYGVNDPNDPTWVRTDISWSIDPDLWENARLQLAQIIEGP